ncbi:hypothetical protein BGZ72_008676 [Mortierella alpina]|nr:hypothetical protein BGZ72_008676 [Mortierella alpina]
MSPAALLTLRILLWLMTTIVLAFSAYLITRFNIRFRASTWAMWMRLILAVISNVVYSFSFRKQSFAGRGSRGAFMFLVCLAWFVPSTYSVRNIIRLYGGPQFFRTWNCGLVECTLSMILDILGWLIGLFGLLEVYLADKYERVYGQKPSTTTTAIFLAPGAQQTAYIPLEAQQQQQPVVSSYAYQHQGYDQSQPLQASPYHPQPGANSAYQPHHF